DLTADMLLVWIAAGLMAAGTFLPGWLRGVARPLTKSRPVQSIFMGLVWAGLFLTVISAGSMVQHLIVHLSADPSTAERPSPGGLTDWRGLPVVLILVWGVAYLASHQARWFLRQFLGDVVLYVTPHTLDRFSETRQAIKDRVLEVGRAVYGATYAGRPL